jgi:hypothetical protein
MLLGQGHYRAALHVREKNLACLLVSWLHLWQCFNKIIASLDAQMEADANASSALEHTLAETYNMRSFAHYGLQDYTTASSDAYKSSQLEPGE